MMETSISEKVIKYETFLNETLKENLRIVIEKREQIYSQLAEYFQLKTVIEKIQDAYPVEDGLKTKVDLGCNFYVQANVPDASRIFVAIGYGFFLEFTLEEAVVFIDKKTDQLTKMGETLTEEACKIKAHIKLMIEGLREIQGISEEPPGKQQRDIFS